MRAGKLRAGDLQRWRRVERFQRELAAARTARGAADATWADPRRQLQLAQYLGLFLFGLFNPVVKSLRGLSAASGLARVQREVCGRPGSLGSFSEAQALVAPGAAGGGGRAPGRADAGGAGPARGGRDRQPGVAGRGGGGRNRYLALIAAQLLLLRTGRRPTKRQMEAIQFYLLGWCSAAELVARVGPARARAQAPRAWACPARHSRPARPSPAFPVASAFTPAPQHGRCRTLLARGLPG